MEKGTLHKKVGIFYFRFHTFIKLKSKNYKKFNLWEIFRSKFS